MGFPKNSIESSNNMKYGLSTGLYEETAGIKDRRMSQIS